MSQTRSLHWRDTTGLILVECTDFSPICVMWVLQAVAGQTQFHCDKKYINVKISIKKDMSTEQMHSVLLTL
uniref:Uncharacterized protein n=1 Tax=Anguilla anguilla TaxID=7936 RepID=A0A0E9TMA9_ANGAN